MTISVLPWHTILLSPITSPSRFFSLCVASSVLMQTQAAQFAHSKSKVKLVSRKMGVAKLPCTFTCCNEILVKNRQKLQHIAR